MGVTPDQLLVHDAFVRCVARRILGEGPEVDDVVQETWIRALDTPPKPTGSLRSWLGVVTRSLSLRAIRSRQRRRNRETAITEPRKTPSTDHVVACEEIRRRLVKAMLGLDEKYRSVLVLRYYDGLPPRRISRRLGIPVETVKTRLRRGVARLRETLNKESTGDRGQWLGALLYLADLRPRGTAEGMAKLARTLGLVTGGLLIVANILTIPERGPGAPTADPGSGPVAVEPAIPVVPSDREEPAGALAATAHARSGRLTIVARVADGPGPCGSVLSGALPPAGAGTSRASRSAIATRPLSGEPATLGSSGPVRILLAGRAAVADDAPLGRVTLIVGGDVPTAADLSIEVQGYEGRSGREPKRLPDGRFRIAFRLPVGTYEVRSNDPEVTIRPTSIVVDLLPARAVEIEISRQVAEFLLVPDSGDRSIEGLLGGQLILVSPDGTGESATTAVDEIGAATVRGLRAGEYDVLFRWSESDSMDMIFLGTVELVPGRTAFFFTVPSEPR